MKVIFHNFKFWHLAAKNMIFPNNGKGGGGVGTTAVEWCYRSFCL